MAPREIQSAAPLQRCLDDFNDAVPIRNRLRDTAEYPDKKRTTNKAAARPVHYGHVPCSGGTSRIAAVRDVAPMHGTSRRCTGRAPAARDVPQCTGRAPNARKVPPLYWTSAFYRDIPPYLLGDFESVRLHLSHRYAFEFVEVPLTSGRLL